MGDANNAKTPGSKQTRIGTDVNNTRTSATSKRRQPYPGFQQQKGHQK
jgi:hypothetical protein